MLATRFYTLLIPRYLFFELSIRTYEAGAELIDTPRPEASYDSQQKCSVWPATGDCVPEPVGTARAVGAGRAVATDDRSAFPVSPSANSSMSGAEMAVGSSRSSGEQGP